MKVLLAVSGGIDSMCMADLCLRTSNPDDLAVAHCNFCLRGEESDLDEELVRTWTGSHGLRFFVKSFDTRGFAAAHGVSIEMAARELRYRWFAQVCRAEGFDAVAVAHNANDNAETLLLNMLRGSGMKGMTGMSAESEIPYAEGSGLRLIRPLLSYTRKQIEGHVFANKVPYRNDSTNSSSEYKRNRLRNEVFPIFEKINPSVVRTLNREMGYFSDAEQIVEDYCRKAAKGLVSHSLKDNTTRVSLSGLKAEKHWKYLLYHLLEPYGFNSAVLASLEELLVSERTVPGKKFHSSSHTIITGRDELIISRSGESGEDSVMPVRTSGTYHFRGHEVRVELLEMIPDMQLRQSEGSLIFDAGKLRFPFVLRGWRHGDWLIPFGMKGKKKVSDLFTDLKYDAPMKEDAIVISDVLTEGMAESQHVAGVAGVRIDDMYKVTSSTSSVLKIIVI